MLEPVKANFILTNFVELWIQKIRLKVLVNILEPDARID